MKRKRIESQIDSSSTADIAFLLLIFFLVATTMKKDKGLDLKLPPEQELQSTSKVNERNLFKIMINADGQYLVENEIRTTLAGLDSEVKEFILNPLNDEKLSESPEKAIISLKTSRKTSYKDFIEVLDELKGVYFSIYADRVQLTSLQYRQLDPKDPTENSIRNKGREGIPMNISIAEATKIRSNE